MNFTVFVHPEQGTLIEGAYRPEHGYGALDIGDLCVMFGDREVAQRVAEAAAKVVTDWEETACQAATQSPSS